MEKIDIASVIAESDRLFDSGNASAVGEHLRKALSQAISLKDDSAALSIYSELMGHYRMAGDRDRALQAVVSGLALLDKLSLRTAVSGGTILINAATALLEFGETAQAMKLYFEAYGCYEKQLDENDPRFAALFNNMSSAYAANGDIDSAEMYCLTAVDILEKNGRIMDCATAYVNLARLRGETRFLDLAMACFDNAAAVRDGYYAHTAAKCAGAFGELGETAKENELRLRVKEIYERH